MAMRADLLSILVVRKRINRCTRSAPLSSEAQRENRGGRGAQPRRANRSIREAADGALRCARTAASSISSAGKSPILLIEEGVAGGFRLE